MSPPAPPGCAAFQFAPGTFYEEMDTMYDMYPDWGPAQHDPDNPLSPEAVQAALDLRDNGGFRPDDN